MAGLAGHLFCGTEVRGVPKERHIVQKKTVRLIAIAAIAGGGVLTSAAAASAATPRAPRVQASPATCAALAGDVNSALTDLTNKLAPNSTDAPGAMIAAANLAKLIGVSQDLGCGAAISNQQPAANNQQPAANNQQPAAAAQQPAANNQQPAAAAQQPAANNENPAAAAVLPGELNAIPGATMLVPVPNAPIPAANAALPAGAQAALGAPAR